MSDKYTLNASGKPVPEPDLITWARWFESADRTVGSDQIGESRVSTVFLGLDHNFGEGPPVLWETMVFGGELEGEQNRCAGSREQAEAMHAKMVERVKASQPAQ